MGPANVPPRRFEYQTVERPKKISELPKYLSVLLGGFFKRLFYIFDIVMKTGKWIFASLLIIAVIEGMLPIIGTLISRSILNALQISTVDAATGAFTPTSEMFSATIVSLVAAFFIYRFLSSVLTTLKNTTIRIAGELVVKEIRVRIMKKAQNLDLASFDIPAFYEKLENANREAGVRPVSILNSTVSIISHAITLISYFILLSSAVPLAAICIIAVSIPTAIINFVYRKKQFNYIRHRSKDRRQMNYYADTAVNKDLAKEIRLFGLSELFVEKYNTVFDRYFKGLKKLILAENTWFIAIRILSCVVNFSFYLLFAWRVFIGEYMIGDYSTYTTTLTSISNAIGSLIATSASIYEGTLFIDNLISFMNEKKALRAIKEEPEEVCYGKAHTIRFENVSFSYPGTDVKVLKNLNFTINAGESVTLVGLNGAGKTTLIKLLTRLYDPTEGKIYLDGKDIREYAPESLYRVFGIIFQDFGKYAFDVSQNIRFGDIEKEGSEESLESRVKEAAKNAGAAEFIERFPEAYKTPLMRIFNDDGIELSIGQWQKLCIARAFYSGNDIMILDEPTASLDPMAEQEIFNEFDRLRKDKTTIFVSHRLSSATTADNILVLEYGELIEQGTHSELMKKNGRYYELFSTQAKRYIASADENE